MSAGDVEQQEAAAPSEWTRVTRKGKRNKSQRQAKSADAGLPPPPPPVAGAPENFQPNSAPQLSVQEIRADHDTIAAKWRGTAGYAQLCEVVKKNASSHAPITRAICLGLGAFDPQDGSWLAQRRSHVQMAAFLAIVDILSEHYAAFTKDETQPRACFFADACAKKANAMEAILNAITRNPVLRNPTRTSSPACRARSSSRRARTSSWTRTRWCLACISTETFGLMPCGGACLACLWEPGGTCGNSEATQILSFPFFFFFFFVFCRDETAREMRRLILTRRACVCRTPEAERSCDFERIKEMDTSFDKFRFPQDEHSSFSSTCIYWKKRSLDDDSNTASRETKDDPDKLDNTSSSEAITEESKDCAT